MSEAFHLQKDDKGSHEVTSINAIFEQFYSENQNGLKHDR